MANRSKIHPVEDMPDTKKFSFSRSFNRSFDALITAYGDTLNKLNKAKFKAEYGVCATDYSLRYITPKNVSSYVSNLVNGIEAGLFHDRINDVEMFTVASIKRFIEENGCVPFEDARIMNDDHGYVNPKEQTLQDLAFIAKNDIGEVAVYSNGEMNKRYKLAGDDIKKINDMHFAANMKNIVKSLPSILEKTNGVCCNSNAYKNILGIYLEEFILFACTLNTVAALQLLAYAVPSVDYTIKEKSEGSNELVTECCLCKTNDFIIRNKIPFNCNMRDVVLQDVTPDFKDTHDALHFIMKDARSPISILVNKFASKEADIHGDCGLIARMFLGGKKMYRDGDLFRHENGERLIGAEQPYDTAGFNSRVAWLDNIAFGNNYLDGNYRRDAMGNNHVEPILNTLDILYKVFGGVELKSNEEIANNIIRVANAIRSIINDYRDDKPIENYDITKDVLVVLGEILTRNMLRLYYNNTQVYAITDDMPDAGAPGFVLEEFVMEADENQGGNKITQTAATAQNSKPTVEFKDKDGKTVGPNAMSKAKDLLNKFIQWVRNTLSKFFDNFNKNHEKEITWIQKNQALNDEIGKAIADGSFKPMISNYKQFKVDENMVKNVKITEKVNEWLNPKNNIPDGDEAFYEMIGLQGTAKDQVSSFVKNNNQKMSEMLTGQFLFGSPMEYVKKDNTTNSVPLDKNTWDSMISDLTGTPKLLSELTKTCSDQLADAGQKAMTASTSAPDDNTRQRADQVGELIKRVSSDFSVPLMNAVSKDLYSKNYVLYRAIVQGYQQQKSSGGNNNASNGTAELAEGQNNQNQTK